MPDELRPGVGAAEDSTGRADVTGPGPRQESSSVPETRQMWAKTSRTLVKHGFEQENTETHANIAKHGVKHGFARERCKKVENHGLIMA